MLRPDKKYSVYDLRQLKGKRCLTHIHVKSPEEAAAAEPAPDLSPVDAIERVAAEAKRERRRQRRRARPHGRAR